MKSRIFVTGDKHGQYNLLFEQLRRADITKDDVVIVLGDHGTLYYGPKQDAYKKKKLAQMPCTFIMIHGNHDARATHKEYKHVCKVVGTQNYAGWFWCDEAYPNILYTDEVGYYNFGNKEVYVIGGAYSVDKYYRLEKQKLGYSDYKWFNDEQLTEEEKRKVEKDLYLGQPRDLYIMSHTCPLKYVPTDMFLSNVDQTKVDRSMEIWLDSIEEKTHYTKWFCGHWHTDRSIDKMRFMFNDLELFDEVNIDKRRYK